MLYQEEASDSLLIVVIVDHKEECTKHCELYRMHFVTLVNAICGKWLWAFVHCSIQKEHMVNLFNETVSVDATHIAALAKVFQVT